MRVSRCTRFCRPARRPVSAVTGSLPLSGADIPVHIVARFGLRAILFTDCLYTARSSITAQLLRRVGRAGRRSVRDLRQRWRLDTRRSLMPTSVSRGQARVSCTRRQAHLRNPGPTPWAYVPSKGSGSLRLAGFWPDSTAHQQQTARTNDIRCGPTVVYSRGLTSKRGPRSGLSVPCKIVTRRCTAARSCSSARVISRGRPLHRATSSR
jgi:hypothetical protein